MTPDEIKDCIEDVYGDELIAEPIENGWSFFYKRVDRSSTNTTRIARASQSSSSAPTRLKRAVTYRWTHDESEKLGEKVLGGEQGKRQVLELVRSELRLYLEEELPRRSAAQRRPEDPGAEAAHGELRPLGARYWAFCANPARYRIIDAVHALDTDWWTIGRSDVRQGDQAIIWQTRDKQGRRGIVAFAEVTGDPVVRSDEVNPFWCSPGDGSEPKARVPVRYSTAVNLPLWLHSSQHDGLLQSLSVARSHGGTVFHVTPGQWRALLDAAGELTTESPETEEALESLSHRKVLSRGGPGRRGLSSTERRTVELHAMECARRYFQESWESVQDMSKQRSFDLLCRTGENELLVEVKGTTTRGESVILTRNEVSISERFPYALFVVSEIVLDRSDPKSPKASGGRWIIFHPWQSREHRLEPIAYECRLDLKLGAPARSERRRASGRAGDP